MFQWLCGGISFALKQLYEIIFFSISNTGCCNRKTYKCHWPYTMNVYSLLKSQYSADYLTVKKWCLDLSWSASCWVLHFRHRARPGRRIQKSHPSSNILEFEVTHYFYSYSHWPNSVTWCRKLVRDAGKCSLNECFRYIEHALLFSSQGYMVDPADFLII